MRKGNIKRMRRGRRQMNIREIKGIVQLIRKTEVDRKKARRKYGE